MPKSLDEIHAGIAGAVDAHRSALEASFAAQETLDKARADLRAAQREFDEACGKRFPLATRAW